MSGISGAAGYSQSISSPSMPFVVTKRHKCVRDSVSVLGFNDASEYSVFIRLGRVGPSAE